MKLIKLFILISILSVNSITFAQEKSFHPDLKAVFWYQQSAEAAALYHQAYNSALSYVKSLDLNKEKKYAVVLDVDETVLDNSPYQAFTVISGALFPTGWSEWTQKADAKLLPGVEYYLNEINDLGIEIFYITNRNDGDKQATIKNLALYKLPFADKGHVLTKSTTSDKTERRAKVEEEFEIVQFVGDNLGDFDEWFQEKPNSVRKSLVQEKASLFGTKYIILPNSMYGEWEGSTFNYNYSIPFSEKYNSLLDSLKSYK